MKKLKTIKTKNDAALVAAEIIEKIAYDDYSDLVEIGFHYYHFDGLKTNSFLIYPNPEDEALLSVERHDNGGGSGFGNIEKKNFPTYVWENRKDINHTGSFYVPDVGKKGGKKMEKYNIKEAEKHLNVLIEMGYKYFCPYCLSGLEETDEGELYCPNEMCLYGQ